MGDDSELTVVFTGHTGLGKRRVLKRLCQFIYDKDPEWCETKGLTNQTIRKNREQELAQVYEAECLIDDTFLDLSVRDQKSVWHASFVAALQRWQQADPKPKYAFLALHLTWQTHSQFFSPLAWRIPPNFEDTLVKYLGEDFRPKHCVTLIDDIYTSQERIKSHKYNFRLIELLRWRNIETLMTDLLAQLVVPGEYITKDREKYPFEHSPVISVRHPISMLYSFLLEPEKPRVYASYPISEPRRIAARTGSNDPIEEINRFRATLHERFTVFDPVTIDERPLQFLLKKAHESEKQALRSVIERIVSITSTDRSELVAELERSIKEHLDGNLSDEIVLRSEDMWPGIECETLSGDDPTDVNLSRNDVEDIATETGEQGSEIDRQIRSRDFRMIDQADYIVVYRPTYCREEWSTGTYHEVLYARSVGKRAIIIRDPTADGPLKDPPFGLDLPPFNVYAKIENLSVRPEMS